MFACPERTRQHHWPRSAFGPEPTSIINQQCRFSGDHRTSWPLATTSEFDHFGHRSNKIASGRCRIGHGLARRLRQECSRPLILEVEAWLREQHAKLSKDNDTTSAINYCPPGRIQAR
jgi:hypothetical protein